MRTHQYFEELSVLAASGDITAEESDALEAHLSTCSSCRQMVADCQVTALLLTIAAEHAEPTRPPAGMRERLDARLRSELPRPKSLLVVSRRAAIAAGILLIFAGACIGVYFGTWTLPSPVLTPVPQQSPTRPRPDNDVAERLHQTQEALSSATQQLAITRKNLENEQQSRKKLEAELTSQQSDNQQLRSTASDRDHELSRLKSEIEQLKNQEDADHIAATVSETEVHRLKQNEAKLTSELNEAKRLQKVLSDTKDLILDRNLQTLYVFEPEKPGKKQRAVGRIFYSEGQRFDFYAWNLADPKKLSTHNAFYLWGETQGVVQKVVSLGKFQVDSLPDGRWVLKVDPLLLTQIGSVFVTEEPNDGAVKAPTGQRILSRELIREPK